MHFFVHGSETTLTLGRSSKVCDVVLDATPAKTISRKHAEIVFGKQRRGPDTYTLRDLVSERKVLKAAIHTLRMLDEAYVLVGRVLHAACFMYALFGF